MSIQEVTILNGKISITALLKAQKTLEDILRRKKNVVTRDAAIQRFEYTFELAWKTLKRVLKQKGVDVPYPNDVFREAARGDLIQDASVWITFLEKRNLTSHTYDERTAEEVYDILPVFRKELAKLILIFRKLS